MIWVCLARLTVFSKLTADIRANYYSPPLLRFVLRELYAAGQTRWHPVYQELVQHPRPVHAVVLHNLFHSPLLRVIYGKRVKPDEAPE